jgi:DNA-binding CsgD family transcriptional regulator
MTRANMQNPFGLTYRECQVMACFMRSGDPQLVALELRCSRNNVDAYLRAIVKKMDVRNKVLAALRWQREVGHRAIWSGSRPANSVFDLARAA